MGGSSMSPTHIRSLTRQAAAAAVCLSAVAPAPGFFFLGWPGDGVERAPSLIGPVMPERVGRPPPDERSTDPDGQGPEVAAAPEPAAAVMVGSGAVAVALARRVMARRRSTS